jgi:hypothetical protein
MMYGHLSCLWTTISCFILKVRFFSLKINESNLVVIVASFTNVPYPFNGLVITLFLNSAESNSQTTSCKHWYLKLLLVFLP